MIECPKCGSSDVETDTDLTDPHECRDCGRVFADKDIKRAIVLTPEDTDDSPLMAGEILGWRAWYIVDTPNGARLQSLNTVHVGPGDHIWEPGQIEVAQCPYEDVIGHRVGNGVEWEVQVPVESCSCGFYAAVSREHLISLNAYHVYSIDDKSENPKCIGQVAMSGKVIPGTQGWKAQEVWPVSLEVPFEFWRYVKPLSEAYNIPVTLARTLEKQKRRQQ